MYPHYVLSWFNLTSSNRDLGVSHLVYQPTSHGTGAAQQRTEGNHGVLAATLLVSSVSHHNGIYVRYLLDQRIRYV